MVQKDEGLAPVLRDLFMECFDRSLMANLDQTITLKLFRYSDDYVIIFNLDDRDLH